MMKFLVDYFPDLSDLKQFLPVPSSAHDVQADEVVPMLVLLKDEKYIADTIDILSQLAEDANLHGEPQVCRCMGNHQNINYQAYLNGMHIIIQAVIGDQLTCKNIRSSKMWRQPEIESKDRLGWACESPGMYDYFESYIMM